MIDENRLKQIINKTVLLTDINDVELVEFCDMVNHAYRRGKAIISDDDYDFIFLAELKKRQPNHPLLLTVENDNNAFGDNKMVLPQPMLSTDKAYSFAEIQKWIERITKSSIEINLATQDIIIKVTPKLDGFAAFDDGKILYTRGDGKKGSDISRVFKRGLQIFNQAKRGLGAGEIVVKKSYFQQELSAKFEHPRNFQASIIKEKSLDSLTQNAIKKQAALFVPFILLPAYKCDINELLDNFSQIINAQLGSVDFDVDGVVLEVENTALKTYMGSNRKFHRWQIAFKENKEVAEVEVLEVVPQVGRTGKITPVARLTPTILSGATISNASCYHYHFVKQQKLGKGSVVELIRSGLVIPKIVSVLKPTIANIPNHCPSCDDELMWQSDFLVCTNHQKCSAQIMAKIEYFFAILGNNDGFGHATIYKLFEFNIHKISQIYSLVVLDFEKFGFGEKTAQNLVLELQKSRTVAIEDYRFLAAFGVERLGLGNSETLLKYYDLTNIFELSAEKIAAINGFADITAKAIVSGLQAIKFEFNQVLQLGFNLEKTMLPAVVENYFTHKKLIFSGNMQQPREQMQKEAKVYGATVQTSISTQTDFLIIGTKVGHSKLAKAQKLGIQILTEDEYYNLLKVE